MDLINVRAVERPTTESDLPRWAEGDTYVGGGTWLFSEPQLHAHRLVDLSAMTWAPIVETRDTVTIAANCTYRHLEAHDWKGLPAGDLFTHAIRSLSASFKTYGLATVGGNVSLAFAKGMMTPVFVTLDAVYELVLPGSDTRRVPAANFQTGVGQTMLRSGEYVRAIEIPRPALLRRCALRRACHSATSHAVAMVIAATTADSGPRTLTLSAALTYPVRLTLASDRSVADQINAACDAHTLLSDTHGSPAYRRALLHEMAIEALTSLDHEI
jgi:CO/xanthine dehydrogenase FAD-binding subunit